MKNPLLNGRHLKEYFLYGGIAAIGYLIPVILLLSANRYENLWYLFIGCAFFMAVIGFFTFKLLSRPYEGRRSMSLIFAGHAASVVGVLLACLLVFIATWAFFPDLFGRIGPQEVLANSPGQTDHQRPSGLLFMMVMATIFRNIGAGSSINILLTYAGKKDQTKDKPTDLSTRLG